MKTSIRLGVEKKLLGSNVPTIGGYHKGFGWGDKWKCECIQIYTTLSRTWNVKTLTPEEINRFIKTWRDSSVKQVVAHIPFLVNLASSNKEIREKSIKRLIIEVTRANKLKIPYLVLHPGSYGYSSRQEGINRLIDSINIVFTEINESTSKLLLETMAGQGKMLGSSFNEMSYILEKIKKTSMFGVCFDTAHVFIAGYDLRGYEGFDKVMDEFNHIIGLNNIGVIHLNDSKTEFGSRNDRHECIGRGKMGLQVFHAILRSHRFMNIPKILEIPDRDNSSENSLALLRELKLISDDIPESIEITKQLTLKGIV